jgi:hypothetical protein
VQEVIKNQFVIPNMYDFGLSFAGTLSERTNKWSVRWLGNLNPDVPFQRTAAMGSAEMTEPGVAVARPGSVELLAVKL